MTGKELEWIGRPDPKDIRPSVVSFLDVLGYKEIVKDKRRSLELFEAIADAINETEKKVAQIAPDQKSPASLACRFFSDNIVVSCGYNPAPKNRKEWYDNSVSISAVLMVQAAVQTRLLCRYGILSRGGTVLGDYYRGDKFVFGLGLSEAYELEESAKTPRIVAEDRVVDEYVESAMKAGLPLNENILGQLFREDWDKKTYVHYLYAGGMIEGILSGRVPYRDDVELLESHRWSILKAIRNNRDSISTSRSVAAKYVWAALYHNDVVVTSGFGRTIDIEEILEGRIR